MAAAATPEATEDEATKKAVQDMRSETRLQALEIIMRRMPRKVIALDTVFKTDPRMNVPLAEIERMFRDDWARQIASSQGGAKAPKKRKMEGESAPEDTPAPAPAVTAANVCVPCNKAIAVAIEVVRSELLELIEVS